MAETPEEKVVAGPPPKLDLRAGGTVKPVGATPAVTPTAPAAAPTMPEAPGPVGAKPSSPFIKLGGPASPAVPAVGAAAPASAGAPRPTVAKRPTLSIPRPPSTASPMPRPAASAAVGIPASKKETSKIPLDQAMAAGGATAKLPDVSVSAAKKETSKIPLDQAMAAQDGGAASPDAKRMTTRISLEAVLMTPEASEAKPAVPGVPGSDTGPKTIRLKRPSEAATVKVSPKPKIAKVEEAGTAEAKAALNRTARLEEAAEEPAAEGDTPSKRKTIRIKRPGEGGGGAGAPQAVSIARGEGGGVPMVMEDEPHVTFPLLGIAACLVVIVTIYMFAAQALGPDLSLTQLSYGVRETSLSWPGKIMPTAQ